MASLACLKAISNYHRKIVIILHKSVPTECIKMLTIAMYYQPCHHAASSDAHREVACQVEKWASNQGKTLWHWHPMQKTKLTMQLQHVTAASRQYHHHHCCQHNRLQYQRSQWNHEAITWMCRRQSVKPSASIVTTSRCCSSSSVSACRNFSSILASVICSTDMSLTSASSEWCQVYLDTVQNLFSIIYH